MQVYSAIILLLTAGMVVLHLFEWRVVPVLVAGAGSGDSGIRAAQWLRRAIHLEGLYYLAILPILFAAPNSVTRSLLAIFALYHWGGAAALQATGFWRKRSERILPAAARRMVTWTLAALDAAEVALLIVFGGALYASLFGSIAVAAVTKISSR
ncbi:MAG: hypothetical protein IT167_11005 [Bryobacterales bacterium]|nr:hypothetical protein [Bryobacterales bacterium]